MTFLTNTTSLLLTSIFPDNSILGPDRHLIIPCYCRTGNPPDKRQKLAVCEPHLPGSNLIFDYFPCIFPVYQGNCGQDGFALDCVAHHSLSNLGTAIAAMSIGRPSRIGRRLQRADRGRSGSEKRHHHAVEQQPIKGGRAPARFLRYAFMGAHRHQPVRVNPIRRYATSCGC